MTSNELLFELFQVNLLIFALFYWILAGFLLVFRLLFDILFFLFHCLHNLIINNPYIIIISLRLRSIRPIRIINSLHKLRKPSLNIHFPYNISITLFFNFVLKLSLRKMRLLFKYTYNPLKSVLKW